MSPGIELSARRKIDMRLELGGAITEFPVKYTPLEDGSAAFKPRIPLDELAECLNLLGAEVDPDFVATRPFDKRKPEDDPSTAGAHHTPIPQAGRRADTATAAADQPKEREQVRALRSHGAPITGQPIDRRPAEDSTPSLPPSLAHLRPSGSSSGIRRTPKRRHSDAVGFSSQRVRNTDPRVLRRVGANTRRVGAPARRKNSAEDTLDCVAKLDVEAPSQPDDGPERHAESAADAPPTPPAAASAPQAEASPEPSPDATPEAQLAPDPERGAGPEPGPESAGAADADLDAEREPLPFMALLKLSKEPVAHGRATGRIALKTALMESEEGAPAVLVANACDSERDWILRVEEGAVVSAHSHESDRSLAAFLKRAGHITDSAVERLESLATQARIMEHEALRALRILDDGAIDNVVASHAKVMRDALEQSRTIDYEIFSLAEEPAKPITLTSEHAAEHTPEDEPSGRPSDASTKSEQAANGAPSFSDWLSGGDEAESAEGTTTRSTDAKAERRERTTGRRRTPVPRQKSARSKSSEPLNELEKAIESHASKVGRVDDFEFLGIHWTSSQSEVDDALEQIEASFDDECLIGVRESLVGKARGIIAKARHIHSQLATRDLRRQYRQAVLSDLVRSQAVDELVKQVVKAISDENVSEFHTLYARLDEVDRKRAVRLRKAQKKAIKRLLS